uniref:Tc1-like transposase DDE domain-containing protein n=1 Tax=Cuerna arida TaxID=1464854 RepID=A0A1B6G3J3_9HEMI
MSNESVRKVLKKAAFKAYRVHLVQELNEDDFDWRLEFCEVIVDRIDRKQILLNDILFSDEVTFVLNGSVNRHNCRYWDNSNPHWKEESHTQHPQKLNVWAGIIGNQIVGPFFINGNLNGDSYLAMLQNEIIPDYKLLLVDNFIEFISNKMARHHTLLSLLENTWIQYSLTGGLEAVEWPARSHDLSLLDFFLWGYLKDKVYRTKPQDLAHLRNLIVQEAQDIPRDYLQNTVDGFYNRLGHCQTMGGEHFEHIL